LITDADIEAYMVFMQNGCKEFPDMKPDEIFAEPLLYTSYEGVDANYTPVVTMDGLKEVLEAKLE